MSWCEIASASDRVYVPVREGRYSVLTVQVGASTMGVVLPHPMEPELAGRVASELADIWRMVHGWSDDPPKPDCWSVNILDGIVELYVPAPPGGERGVAMGLGEEETVELIDGLAQALAAIRAERKAAEVRSVKEKP